MHRQLVDTMLFAGSTNVNLMTANPTLGGYQLWTILHELGHALGLAHPYDSGHGTNPWSSKDITGDTPLDNVRYTVMSEERGEFNNPDGKPKSGTSGLPVSLMALDIAAMQEMYGPKDYATDNSTYILGNKGAVTTVAENAVTLGQAFYCIWDTGGQDIIRYNGTNRVFIGSNDATLQTTDSGDTAYLAFLASLQQSYQWGQLPTPIKNELF